MAAWVVLDRRHYRRAGTFALPLSTPPFPLPHLTPLLPYSYGHSYTTAAPQPLCNQSFTHSFYRDGGCTPRWLSPRDRDPYSLPTTHLKFFLFTFLRTLLHIFAFFCTHQKLNSLVFNRFRTLCTKHPGGGVPPCSLRTDPKDRPNVEHHLLVSWDRNHAPPPHSPR